MRQISFLLLMICCATIGGFSDLTQNIAVDPSGKEKQQFNEQGDREKALNVRFGGLELDWSLSHAALTGGGFIIAGNTLTQSVQRIEAWVLWVDAHGKRIFERRFNKRNWTEVNSVAVHGNGGAVIAGRLLTKTGLNGWVVSLDRRGNKLFEKNFGGAGDDWGNSIAVLADGGFAIAGYKGSQQQKGNGSAWVFKLDENGELVWEKSFGNFAGEKVANGIAALKDGGLIIVGEVKSPNGRRSRAWVLRLDAAGHVIFDKSFGSAEKNWGRRVAVSTDGSIVFAGSKLNKGAAGYDALVVKLDEAGALIWEKSFGGKGNDWAHDVLIYPDGGYAVAGWSDARGAKKLDAVVRRLNETGDLIWRSSFGGEEIDRIYSISLDEAGGIGLAGVTHTKGAQGKDAWLVTIPRSQMPLEARP